jgi:hypothetical protein
MANKLVHITIKDGRLKISPYHLKTQNSDTVIWDCNKGPFAVQFLERSPFSESTFISGRSRHQKSAKVRSRARKDSYEYAVAVYWNGRIYLDANCPAIIID